MAPLTGDCIAALACDEVPAADIGPFAVSRFREAQ
jgi:glycine/D-amino acid oxidase-like deaminating enzyme